MNLLERHVEDLRAALGAVARVSSRVESAAAALAATVASGGKILAAGNGGSAAEAQHFSAELVGRLYPHRERGPLPAVALHADTSTLTAVGNDYGYDQVFARQVEALGRPGDALVVFSTSGRSPNLVRAVEVAARLGVVTVGLLGAPGSPLHERCDHVLGVDSASMAAVQECHLVLLHVLVESVEDRLAAGAP